MFLGVPDPRRARTSIVIGVLLSVLTTIAIFTTSYSSWTSNLSECLKTSVTENNADAVWDKSTVLKGQPTRSFRENLRDDTFYLTVWTGEGLTNQFMGYTNMIHLALMTDRVPIVPPFAPNRHIDPSAGLVPFGDVFDLDHLRTRLRGPVLEWRDVKVVPKPTDPNPYPYEIKSTAYTPDPIGCWSTKSHSFGGAARSHHLIQHIGIDASYTRVPAKTRIKPSDLYENHVVFSQMAALIHRHSSTNLTDFAGHPYPDPQQYPKNYEFMEPGREADAHTRMPDQHLTCFDTLYYACTGAESYEWRFAYSPAWRGVGKWLRFSQRITSIADEYMATLFTDSRFGNEYPPFIAVHARRGDFCGDAQCPPVLDVYQKEVEGLIKELQNKKSVEVKHVIFMSDESDPAFWDAVKSAGWLRVDHDLLKTSERLGQWYPTIIDVAIQSRALGFVGTERSTLSLLSQKRVIDWNGGIVRVVDPRKP